MWKRLVRWVEHLTDDEAMALSICLAIITGVCTVFNFAIFVIEIRALIR